MASKSKGKAWGRDDTLKKEDVIQAVVLADSFSSHFTPVTKIKPAVLLPLVNCPLLDYTLECLSNSGVLEVFLFCCSHPDQIKEHVKRSKWSCQTSPMLVTVIVSEDCCSIGDALRYLDSKAIIRNDFIFMSGDVVANVQLVPILMSHRETVKKDKGAIMTMVYRRAAPGYRARCAEDETVLAVDVTNNQIFHHQKVRNVKKLNVPLEIFQVHSDVDLCFDLLDTHISICSAAVPPLFADNFDYQSRDDFVKGILVNEEILGNTIYCHILEEEYAASVSNLYMYDAVSQDLINRWVYPIVPDLGINSTYSFLRYNIYKQKNVTLAKRCILEEDVVIGEGTKIGENTFITHSVIGCHCNIGDNVKIDNSYVWDNVIIKDNCTLSGVVVAEGSTLRNNVTIKSQAVLGPNVDVGPDVTIESGIKLTAEPCTEDIDEFSDDEKEEKTGSQVLENQNGDYGSKAFVFKDSEDSDSDAESPVQEKWGPAAQSEEEGEEDSESDFGSEDSSDLGGDMSPPPDDTRIFYTEVFDSLVRGYEEGVKTENLVLEINSSKFAYNVTLTEVSNLVTKAVLSIPDHQAIEKLEAADLLEKLNSVLIKFLPILRNYMKSEEAQTECMRAIEEYAGKKENFQKIILRVLHLLYKNDILNEEVILDWYESPAADPAEGAKIRKQVEPFVRWLKETEEESEEEESD